MVDQRYKESKQKEKLTVAKVSAVSLTSDMWTSINTEAYLAVTCHFIDSNTALHSVVLGVQHFPQAHTAINLSQVTASLMSEWGITDKVRCYVTDGAANMGACAKELRLRHSNCVAHTWSKQLLITLSDIQTTCRRMVGYFKSSTTAKVCSIISLLL